MSRECENTGDGNQLRKVSWPHAPTHCLSNSGTYFVTAATYNKAHIFISRQRLDVLHRGLLSVACEFNWQLEAWAVFSNHYHFVAHSPGDGAQSLPVMLKKLHGSLACWVNRLDNCQGRKVWFNYWKTEMTVFSSYMARLNYVHNNPVKHGLVESASCYPWCSAAWFESTAKPAQIKKIYAMKWNTVNVPDDYVPLPVE